MLVERVVNMSNEQVAKPKKKKLSSQILRERLGAVPPKPLQISREHAKIKKRLKGANILKDLSDRTICTRCAYYAQIFLFILF